ncbi:MAG: hypothetical protein J6Z08_02685 [Elusimicrobiales bacterium]|nr:hypothetical protein [Elusimicrobiales bacterium]
MPKQRGLFNFLLAKKQNIDYNLFIATEALYPRWLFLCPAAWEGRDMATLAISRIQQKPDNFRRFAIPKNKNIIKGRPLPPPAGIAAWYKKELRRLTAEMLRSVSAKVEAAYKETAADSMTAQDEDRQAVLQRLLDRTEKEFARLFEEKALELSARMAAMEEAQAGRATQSAFNDLKAALTIRPMITPELKQSMQAIIAENVNLIKSIQNRYFEQIRGAVNRALLNGGSYSELKAEISKYNGQNLRRAGLIARDQSHKAWTALSMQKMKDAGINGWEWVHGGGVKTPRETHIKTEAQGGINHTIHKTGEKAYDPQKGIERGILPGELPYCRCFARPVIIIEGKAG